ncbi:hypothetical protein ACOJUR_12625 [Alicyclobacillus tolerans]|uniref:hypothetical protein n=1 Tax=Alicyclobacillus tolerans TaxID=90970 RepID=UPI003B7B30E2
MNQVRRRLVTLCAFMLAGTASILFSCTNAEAAAPHMPLNRQDHRMLSLDQQSPHLIFAVAHLQPEHHSNVHGKAELIWDEATQSLSVRVDATGLQPQHNYPLRLHNFTVADHGPTLYALTSLYTDKNGSGHSLTILHNVTYIPDGHWFVAIHAGLNFDTELETLAAGNIHVLHPLLGEHLEAR